MMHLTDEEIYLLAEKKITDQEYDDCEFEKLSHIRSCDNCYKLFCASLAVAEVMNPPEIIEDYYEEALNQKNKPSISPDNILASIKIIRQQFSDTVSAIVQQVQKSASPFSFVSALPMASRGNTSNIEETVKIELEQANETWIAYDPLTRDLAIRLEEAQLPSETVHAYVRSAGHEDIEIPLQRAGNYYMGFLSGIEIEDFDLQICTEQK